MNVGSCNGASAPQPPGKLKLLDRVREAIRVRHYSPRTEQAYVHWIRQGTWENRPARDRRGLLSHLVPALLASDQAGLVDSAVGRRVTAARSCPSFSGFVLSAQQLPARGRRVTPQAPTGGAAHDIPAAGDAPPPESPAGPSRGERRPSVAAAPHDTQQSSSSASPQLIDAGETTSGRNSTASARSSSSSSPSSGVWITTTTTPSPPTPAPSPTRGVGLFWRADPSHFCRAPKPPTPSRLRPPPVSGCAAYLPPPISRRGEEGFTS